MMRRKSDRLSTLFIGLMVVGIAVYEGVKLGTDIYDQLEVDPLTITNTDSALQNIGCGGIVYLPRKVITTKPLKVTVSRQFKAVSGTDLGSTYDVGIVTYEEYGPVNKRVVYKLKTPEYLPDGVYLYTPTLNYQVNENKTITKVGPSQVFQVTKEDKCNDK